MRKLKMEELGRLSPQAFKAAPKTPVVLVLDNVRSALNVGSAFRTADAFALEQVILCGITAQPPHREILKTALGASESMDWRYFPQTTEAIEALKAEAYTVLAIEQAEGSDLLDQFHGSDGSKYALVFGNEVKGVVQEVVSASDAVVEIPQFGTKHSLNISVSAGVCVWDFWQKLKVVQ